jgi:hypothetical protein
MTWRLSHFQETSFHEEDVKGEWSDSLVAEAAKKVANLDPYEHMLTDLANIIKEFLPEPIQDEL